jgi:hypothetical protein
MADLADLILEPAGDALTDIPNGELRAMLRLTAVNERGAALLRMWCDPKDPPTTDHDGNRFIVFLEDQLEDIVRRAELAGVIIWPLQRRGSCARDRGIAILGGPGRARSRERPSPDSATTAARG